MLGLSMVLHEAGAGPATSVRDQSTFNGVIKPLYALHDMAQLLHGIPSVSARVPQWLLTYMLVSGRTPTYRY